MRREPRSAVIAEPPAPAISSAVATGADSRTTARTMAAPMWASAPSCFGNEPTCSAMITPNGIEISTTGSIVTFAMNQHCSMNSPNGKPFADRDARHARLPSPS
jgi:hypothetical protein